MRCHPSSCAAALLAFALAGFGLASGQEALVPYDMPQVQLGAYTTPFQRLFDFDADGDVDAIGARTSLYSGTPYEVQAQLYTNPGDGAFQTGWTAYWPAPAGSATSAPIAVGDLDGDGYDDFALGMGPELWRFFSNAPAGGFTRVVEAQGAAIRSLAVADFDGDGADDVALLLGMAVEVHLAGGAVLAASSPMPLDVHDHLLAADTDGDPLPDLVLASGSRMQPFTVLGAALQGGHVMPFADYGPMVDGGDADGDGDTDLVAFHMATPTLPARVEIFRRIGAQQWQTEPVYAGGPAEYLADIDGDGDPDGVCCSSGGGGTFPELTFSSTFEIALNQDGVFAGSVQIPGIGSKSLAGARDVDGDGDKDLVAGRCVYFSRGDGTFAPQPMVMDPAPAGTIASGPRVLGDFDGDGDADAILGVSQDAGGFAGAFLYQGLWRNHGGGSFHLAGPCAQAGVSFYVDGSDQAYLVGDFEADGDLDLAMRATPASWASSYGETHVYRNDGQAFFQAAADYASEQAKAIADFDQDGYNDLITSKPVAPGGVSLLRGLPAGSPAMFGTPVAISGWSGIGKYQLVDVADFNQDGYPDVALTAGSGQPYLYLNGIPLGLGTTLLDASVSADQIQGYWGDPRVFGVDANGDGRMDVVAGPFQSERSWRVYVQKAGAAATLGPGAFEPGVGVVLSPWLRDDADGDGDVDLWGEFLAASVAIHGPDTGAREQYGFGSPGEGGVVPTLGASGPFRAGELMQLRLRGAHGQLAYLAVSKAGASVPGFLFPGLTLLVDPSASAFLVPWPVAGAAGGPGAGAFTIPVLIDPAWAGLELYHQVFVLDAGAPGGLLSASNGLRLLFGS